MGLAEELKDYGHEVITCRGVDLARSQWDEFLLELVKAGQPASLPLSGVRAVFLIGVRTARAVVERVQAYNEVAEKSQRVRCVAIKTGDAGEDALVRELFELGAFTFDHKFNESLKELLEDLREEVEDPFILAASQG